MRHPRLFREATQLKTVGTRIRIAWIETVDTDQQMVPPDIVDRRRLAETDVANPRHRSPIRVAVARGGADGKNEFTARKIILTIDGNQKNRFERQTPVDYFRAL